MILTATLAGFADTHSAAASVASLVASGNLDSSSAALPILSAITSNAATQAIFAVAGGGGRFARPVIAGLVLVIGAAWLGAWIAASF